MMSNFSRPARLYLTHVALLTFGISISGIFFNLALVSLGYDQRTLRLPLLGELSLLGVLNSLPVLAAALSSLPLWWLVGRVGLRASLIIAAGLASIPLLSVALWPEPLPLLVGTAIGGPAAVLFQVSAAPLMMRASGAQGRDLLFSVSFGLSIGVAGLGSLVGGLMPGLAARLLEVAPQSAGAYRATFAISALVVLASAAPLLALRVPPAAGAGGDAAPIGGLLRELLARPWGTLRFLISPLLISCGAALLIPYLSLYFRLRYGAPDAALGLIFAAVDVATGAATLLAPQLSARLGRPASVVLTQAIATPCLLLLGMAPALWMASSVAIVRGALMNMAAPLYEAHAMEQTPEAARPLVIGLISGAYSAGYIIGPTVSAEVQRSYGFAPLFAATAACYCLAALANYLIFVRPGARPGAERGSPASGV
ncbi:MFS transporter [Oscillochloris sp. ZM17-4]|uniref:MFS transporter n=1 Tax=Oscillochloris sp. ZM17-4 TaxID=2866714 RepID=UPI001C72AA89|nr:MFS transporter [Oscillochloris sp. ZM17-4]MBX0329248.1 MFS transporter [Oscillochloris sp. ZM17-4]